jgi:hypothetical protein
MIRIFKDKDCKQELEVEDGKPMLDIKEYTNVGGKRKIALYVVNTFQHPFQVEELEFFDEDLDAESMSSEDLLPNIPTKITLVFSPKKDRLTKLNTQFLIHGRYIIG